MTSAVDVLVGAAIGGNRLAVERLLASIQPLIVRYCRARVGRQERSYASADDVAQEVCLAVLTALPSYRDQGRPFLAFVYGIAAHKVADAHRSAARNRSDVVPEFPDSPDVFAPDPEQQAILADELASIGRAPESRGVAFGLGPDGVEALIDRSSFGRPPALDARRRFAGHTLDVAAATIVADSLRQAALARPLTDPELVGELSDQMARLMGMLPPKQREILILRVVVGLSAEETADAVGSTPGAVRVAQHRALNRLRKALTLEEVV